ncbi:RTA1 like protein-domain-containing protein [Crepidotus variabilis]|uniref:RTA1 like protein-domain-containing protein n=1 Tax=Crepidotus variabilis TaxID=179855 RepID=A0A9P6EL80_9AGAR|nr:RTA1 like protein-domain-containing protein [Crepidotus variabilis]
MGLKAQCLDPHNQNAVFLYCPSIPAAILFAVLFGLLTIAHLTQSIVFRKRFCWVIIMGGIWETTGFVFRVLTILHQGNSTLATAYGNPSQLLILLSPLWVNAFTYVLFGRMVYFFLPARKILGVRAQRMGLLFVLLDIVAFIFQGAGGVMADSTDDSTGKIVKTGLHVYMGGIGFQEFFMLLFTLMVIKFHREMLNVEYPRPGWKKMVYMLYAVLLLITIRIIYRLVEFSQGVYSTLTMHEVYFYVLEALPMMLAFLILAIWHPGTVLVGPESEFPKKEKKSKKDKKEPTHLEESSATELHRLEYGQV